MKRVLKVVCANNTEWWHKPAIWGIQQAEGTDFNHVAIITEFEMVFEAVWPKTKKTHFSFWKRRFEIVRTYELHLDHEQYLKFYEICEAQIGKPYSVWQCAMIYVAQSVKALQKKIEWYPWNGKKALICSEFVARPMVEVLGAKFDQGLDTVGMDEIESALKVHAARVY